VSADWIAPALAVAAAAGGYAVGIAHFGALRRVADMLVAGRLAGVALQLARMGALALFLTLCALAGAAPLVAGAAGVLAGRARVLRREER
jgi:hypothetical protein